VSDFYTSAYLRDEITRLIYPTIHWRRVALDDNYPLNAEYHSPPTSNEVDDFIFNCLSLEAEIFDVLADPDSSGIELAEEQFSDFQEEVSGWTDTRMWLGGDDVPRLILIPNSDNISNTDIIHAEQERYEQLDLLSEQTRRQIFPLSPFLGVLEKLRERKIDLGGLHWRELEELVAELLEKDGYDVQLGKGRKDGGADIIATKEIENIGFIKGVWQAKKRESGKPVGIGVIRELADTRQEMKASKGIIVTTTFLTRDAIARITRDKYILGKVERPELERWIDRVLMGR
jgi:hypothetical protein